MFKIVHLLCFFSIFTFLAVTKYLVGKIPTKRERCKWEMPIGLAGITVCTIAMRISIFYMEGNVKSTILLFLLTTNSCLILYTYFILPYDEYCIYPKKISKLGERGSLIVALLNLTVFIASIRNVSDFTAYGYWIFVIFAQLFYTIVCIASTVYLFLVLTGNVWLDKSPIFDFIAPIQTTVSPYLPDCKICLLAYTNFKRIPRILKNCGHTICEVCARTLQENGLVICPFCRTPTVVDPFCKLPKNFAVLDILNDLNSL
ncbi:unnamed protein product [Caenorhabditis nigoni]